MSTGSGLLFCVCGVMAFLAAIFTVTSRSPIRAAVSLLFHIIALAGLYLTLHAELLAAIQLIVYAGAIVVLFIFVIMLIGPSAVTAPDARGLLTRTFAGALMSIVGGAITFAVIDTATPADVIPECVVGSVANGDCQQFGGVQAVGTVLYGRAALPFELVSILLLVAILGAIAVARGRTTEERDRLVEKKKAAADTVSPAE